MYKLKNIKKKFKSQEVLTDINLEIEKGEIIAIIGENGAGKTTLLKIMLNLLNIDSGEISFKGKSIKKYKNDFYKYIGIVLEGQDNLYSYISGIENIYYFGSLFGLSKKESYRRSHKYLKLFDLEKAKNKKVGDYSTGMLQKLAIIIALLNEPEVLFLDEPTLGLDIKSNNELIKTLINLNKEKNITIILTSHEVETIERLANKIAYLKEGAIVEYDEIKKFKERNTTTEVKIILKEVNLIKTKIVTYKQKENILYLKDDFDGNKMLNYLTKKEVDIVFYGQESSLKKAILNLGKGVKG